jgi:hypothetical protein
MLIDEALERAKATLEGMMIPGSEAEKMAAVKDTIGKVVSVVRRQREAEAAKKAQEQADKEAEADAD